MDKSDVIARLATQRHAIQCGSCQNGLPRFLAKPRNDWERRTNPMSLRDLQRKAKQSRAVLSKMDCRGFLRNLAMTEDDGQIDVMRLATQGEAIQCGSLQNGLPRFLAEPRNDRGRWTNPMSLRDLQRKAKQSSAVLVKMDGRGFL